VIRREVRNRDIALLLIHYDGYNSPTPSSFLRIGQALTEQVEDSYLPPDLRESYGPDGYVILTLTSRIARGGTGVAHGATLELWSEGKLRHEDTVVKLAFSHTQCQRLRREFSFYEHLARSGVKGIPAIFGLFEDVESGTLALVMSHVGTCLWVLRSQEYQKASLSVDAEVQVTTDEQRFV